MSAPAPTPVPPKKTSTLRWLIYLILAILALTIFLEMSGLADVAGKRENQQIIDRPHQ
ncbi:hypothetical protein QWY85_01480 [Neolewinella lacunae]|uniref:Uncharacterized protein n=1 Tax=Neolewinella lacunae TaxID=1517758 RepID=A0A923TD28_9BACT|nr:hypothetical protein [Neolewinella lacunae]MBC6994377.1 hypothetical protein [Neolewinella lacunae]MDN3633308.1 hypothetical protein [Neolewinella lacunae]